jgi:uncharacterized protein YuzE
MSKILRKKQEIQIEIDEEAKAAYIYFGKKSANNLRSEPVNEDIVIDYSSDGKIHGIEILSLKILDLNNMTDISNE